MADTIPVEGNLDLKGNQIKNVAIDVVTSLPSTNNFVGRQVTYQGRIYIYNGSEWESNRNWLNVFIDDTTPYMYAKLFTISSPFQNIELNIRPHTYYNGDPVSVNYLLSIAYNRVVINKLSSHTRGSYNLYVKKVTPSVFEIYVGLTYGDAYRNSLYADITNVRNSIVSSVELFQTLDATDTNVWTSLLSDNNYFTEFHSLKTNKLKVNGASISDETINFDTNNIEPTQAGTVTKTSTWLWQYLVQSINYSWLKLKTWVGGLFSAGSATTNNNYLPKIDDVDKKLVKSNIQDNGTTPKYGSNTIWHSGNDGSGSGLDADLLDGNHAAAFATSTHNHDGTYSTTDTKNTAGATDTSSKIYLVGSAAQSENPQTYTHDTAYVGTDGNLYSGSSKTITNSDLETNQLYSPTLNPVWNIVKSNGTTPSGIVVTTSAITLEYGYRPSATVKAKWTKPSGFDTPERSDGLCGTYSIPNQLAINTDTNPAANIPYATYFDPVSPTTPSKSVVVWTIYANKKGITVSGNKLIMPTGEISKSASLSVTYQLPIYYGVVTVNSMTEIIIKGLPSLLKNCNTGSKTFSPTINALDAEYWVYAYPSAWGVLSNLSNADGDWTAAFTTGLINIVSSNTLLTTQYRYYITVNKGAFKNKTINFS